MKLYWNASKALACAIISLNAIALPPTPQATLTANVSIAPENSTYSLCFLSQQARFHCEKKPPRSDPPGGSR